MRATIGILMLFLVTGFARGQAPAGHYLVSAVKNQGTAGGIFVAHPRDPGPPSPLTGLGPELTGAGNPENLLGANSIALRPDGLLVAGESSGTGESVDIHVLTVAGTAVVADVAHPVGVAAQGSGNSAVTQCHPLSDGRIVFAVHGLAAGGPLGTETIGVLDPSTGAVSAVPTGLPATTLINALTVDEAASVIYFGTWSHQPAADVFAVPLGGGVANPVAHFPASINNLDVSAAGDLIVGWNYGISRLDPNTGGTQPISTLETVYGVAEEIETGAVARARQHDFGYVPAGGPPVLLHASQVVWTGIAVSPSIRVTAPGRAQSQAYSWSVAPNPGGLPRIGNGGFSLTLDATGSGAPGYLVITTGNLPTDSLAQDASTHLAPDTLTLILPLAAAPSVTIPLGIPPDPTLRQHVFLAQSLHLEPAGLATSDVVRVTIF